MRVGLGGEALQGKTQCYSITGSHTHPNPIDTHLRQRTPLVLNLDDPGLLNGKGRQQQRREILEKLFTYLASFRTQGGSDCLNVPEQGDVHMLDLTLRLSYHMLMFDHSEWGGLADCTGCPAVWQ